MVCIMCLDRVVMINEPHAQAGYMYIKHTQKVKPMTIFPYNMKSPKGLQGNGIESEGNLKRVTKLKALLMII